MKTTLTLFSIIFCSFIYGQNCFCDKDTIPNDFFHCDTTTFDNKAFLHWNYNCDSTWLTFEKPPAIKTIIYSLGKDMRDMVGRIGYVGFIEYNNSFIAMNKSVSACCFPLDYYLYNKTNGQLKTELGSLLYYSENRKYPITVGVTAKKDNTRYELKITNIDSHKEYYLELPRNEFDLALKNNDSLYLLDIFDESIVKDNHLFIKYYLTKDKIDTAARTITIDLNKYCN
jgi:hypothetical protein